MRNRDGAEIRRERMDQLIDLIKNHENEITFTKYTIIGIFMLQTGLTPERIRDYIPQLLDIGFIRSEGNKLFCSKKKEE